MRRGQYAPPPRYRAQRPSERQRAPRLFNDDGRWQENSWRQALSTACALIRLEQLEQKKEAFDVRLNEKSRDRSYLYGACWRWGTCRVQPMDQNAYRQTNAIRYMQRFHSGPLRCGRDCTT